MFNLNPEIVCNVIKKAKAVNISEDLELPDEEDELSEVEWRQIMAEYQNDLSYLELKDLIKELEPDQQQDLIALMYLGRGDFTESEWHEAREQAATIKRANRADYLIAKSMLADYLTEGLTLLGYACEE